MIRQPPSPPTPSPQRERGLPSEQGVTAENHAIAIGDGAAPLSLWGEGPGVRGAVCHRLEPDNPLLINLWFTNSVAPCGHGQNQPADPQGTRAETLDDSAGGSVVAGLAQPAGGRVEVSPQVAFGVLRCGFLLSGGAAGGRGHGSGATLHLARTAGPCIAAARLRHNPPVPRDDRKRPGRRVGGDCRHRLSQALTRSVRHAFRPVCQMLTIRQERPSA